jgi:hypothetical protein
VQHQDMLTVTYWSCHRLAIKVALAQICGKDVADHVEIKKTEDG